MALVRQALTISLVAATGRAAAGQSVPQAIQSERAEFAQWLSAAPSSPFKAIAQVPVGAGITIGPKDSDLPLDQVDRTRIEERSGTISITIGGATRPLPRDRLIPIGQYRVIVAGLRGRATVTAYGPSARSYHAPKHFPYRAEWRLTVSLEPAKSGAVRRILASDGTEVEATEAGTVSVPASAGRPAATLQVLRIPSPGGEESELEIYFQDPTNKSGSYPAGRFVTLVPDGSGRYSLDFNRARNPFCAYNTVFPCPAPWRGNRVGAPIDAGETYEETKS